MTEFAPNPTKWEEPVQDAEGQVVGQIKAYICHSQADLNASIGFSDGFGGFAPYAEQISATVVWPIAALTDLDVQKEFRGRGCGTAALHQFFAYARAEGAGIAFLRVGWWDYGRKDWESARDDNIQWYSRRGFRLLKPASPAILTPYMYCFL